MEFVEDLAPIENIHTKEKPRFYNVNIGKRQIYILPLGNLVDYDVSTLLEQLRITFGTHYFGGDNTKIQKNILLLKSRILRESFYEFMINGKMDPIRVVKVLQITDPANINMTKTYQTVDQEGNPLKYISDIYRPIGGNSSDELISLSIYFKCTHIPVIITI
jgi:hypothetical protein